MKRLGQHFLSNERILKKIAGALPLSQNSAVIEIGPGHGELTEHLLRECARTNSFLIAVEKDPRLASALKKKFSLENRLEVVGGDILAFLPARAPRVPENFFVVGNIPYYLTGKLLRTIGELARKPRVTVLTLQGEVAERVSAKPPKMNRLAASVQIWAEPEILGFIPEESFRPRPAVASAIVRLTLRKDGGRELSSASYYRALGALFRQPRKTILNNLVSGNIKGNPNKDVVEQKLFLLGVRPSDRPQNLRVETISAIGKEFF